MTWRPATLLVLSVLATGCPSPPTQSSGLALDQQEISFTEIGQTVALDSVLRKDSKTAQAPVTWTSENPTVAEIDADRVIARDSGTTRLVGTLRRDPSKTVSVTTRFALRPVSLKVSPLKLSLSQIGEVQDLQVDIRLNSRRAAKASRMVTWESDHPEVAIIGSDNRLIARGNGKARITGKLKLDPALTTQIEAEVTAPAGATDPSPVSAPSSASPELAPVLIEDKAVPVPASPAPASTSQPTAGAPVSGAVVPPVPARPLVLSRPAEGFVAQGKVVLYAFTGEAGTNYQVVLTPAGDDVDLQVDDFLSDVGGTATEILTVTGSGPHSVVVKGYRSSAYTLQVNVLPPKTANR